jgi:hypothetical protein
MKEVTDFLPFRILSLSDHCKAIGIFRNATAENSQYYCGFLHFALTERFTAAIMHPNDERSSIFSENSIRQSQIPVCALPLRLADGSSTGRQIHPAGRAATGRHELRHLG